MHFLIFIFFIFSIVVGNQPFYLLVPPAAMFIVLGSGTLKTSKTLRIMGLGLLVFIIFFFIHLVVFGVKNYFFEGLARYFCYVSLYFFFTNVSGEVLSKYFNITFIYFSLTAFLYKVFLYEKLGALYDGGLRYTNLFYHPSYCAYVLCVVLFWYLRKKGTSPKTMFMVLPVVISIVLTKTTGAIFTTVLILCYFCVAEGFKQRRSKALLCFVFLLLCFCVHVGLFSKIVYQVSSVINPETFSSFGDNDFGGGGSAVWRILYWGSIVSAFSDGEIVPKIFGFGLKTMSKGSYVFDGFMYTDPHNDFLRYFVEMGFLGLSILVILLVKILRGLGRSLGLFLLFFPSIFFDNALMIFPYVFISMALIRLVEIENVRKIKPLEIR